MKRLLTSLKYIALVALGSLVTWYLVRGSSSKVESTEDADVIIERIKSVKKLIVTEGYFSEVYNYKEAKKYFYDLVSFEKKALLLVKGKVQISYNMELIRYEIDEENKTIILRDVPKPETIIEPTIKYYDLKESSFNTFSSKDYNKLNSLAIKKLRQQIKKSNLEKLAEKSLAGTLEDMQWIGKKLGWKVKIKRKT